LKPVRPILPSALLVALFIGVVLTPVEVIGCRNRGLLAVTLILLGLSAALVLIVRGLWRRVHGGPGPQRDEVVTVLLLMLPAIYLVATEF